jgi:hypothetical protein
MNSKQRRKSRRYWKYDVVMDYYNEDKDPWEARCWLEENIGKIGLRWGNLNSHPWQFFFKDSKDAAFFSLKWL